LFMEPPKNEFAEKTTKDKNMTFSTELLNLNYLVYSSHKSGTQTLVATLKKSGFSCRHCHYLPNIDLKSGELREYLESYYRRNRKKLDVITVFREPMERHVSSFFQGYGSRPLRLKEVEHQSETIIYNYTINQLHEKFISELRSQSLIGFTESMHEITTELQISIQDFPYNNEKQFGIFETQLMRLFFFRFDVLFGNLERFLAEVTGKNVVIETANLSELKWYVEIYSEFKKTLEIPDEIIMDVYNSKRDLIDLFYSGDYDSALNYALERYGEKRRIS
jgi:hypothetical protein